MSARCLIFKLQWLSFLIKCSLFLYRNCNQSKVDDRPPILTLFWANSWIMISWMIFKFSSLTSKRDWQSIAFKRNVKKQKKDLMNIRNYFLEEHSNMQKRCILVNEIRIKVEKWVVSIIIILIRYHRVSIFH